MGRWSESKHQQALNCMLNCDKYKLRNSTSTLSLEELVKPVTCFFHHEWCQLMTDATLCYDLREINKKTYKHFDNKQQINTKNDEWTILITPAKRKRRKKMILMTTYRRVKSYQTRSTHQVGVSVLYVGRFTSLGIQCDNIHKLRLVLPFWDFLPPPLLLIYIAYTACICHSHFGAKNWEQMWHQNIVIFIEYLGYNRSNFLWRLCQIAVGSMNNRTSRCCLE